MRLMRLQDFYPIVVTEHLAACRDFYGRWFDLDIVFQASWCVLLGARESRGSLAFMHPDHPSAPPGPEPFQRQGGLPRVSGGRRTGCIRSIRAGWGADSAGAA